MLAFFVKNKKINQRVNRGRMLTTTIKNRNKSRRDHDDTQAGSSNNQLALKILAWFARGDWSQYSNQKIIFEW